RLLGAQYKPGLEHAVEAALSKHKFERSGGFRDTKPAKGGEPIGQIILAVTPTLELLRVLADQKLEVQLTPQQVDLLRLGAATVLLWGDFLRSLRESDLPLPQWYTRDIFEREMAQHGALLRAYAAELDKAGAGDATTRVKALESIGEVVTGLYQPA